MFRRVTALTAAPVLLGLLGAAAALAGHPNAHAVQDSKVPCLPPGMSNPAGPNLEVMPKRCTMLADALSSGDGAHHPVQAAGPRASSNVALPARAAFYYPWYPETWRVGGQYPHYHPALDYYSSSSQAVVDHQIKWMAAAKINVGIASWWGPGRHGESARIPLLMNETRTLRVPLKWTVYYEKEGIGDPTVSEIERDLTYLSTYAQSSQWAYVNGKPVIFVYSGANDACGMADRWRQAASKWYVVLKVFPGYRLCPSQPDSWHQYSPAVAEDHQSGYSFSISPGFWKADETAPRLPRNPGRFQQNVTDMVNSREP